MPVALQHASANHKLGHVVELPASNPLYPTCYKPVAPFVVSTYVSIRATCPDSCPLKDAGCYAQGGFTAMVVGRLDKAASARRLTHDDVIALEAQVIADAWKRRVPQDGWHGRGRDMRLHVSGDCVTKLGATMLDAGAQTFQRRGGGRVWTFTHGWRDVRREHWGVVSILASIERPEDAAIARMRGYASALVVPRFKSSRYFDSGGSRFLPCPAQTRGATCVDCRLCLDDRKLVKSGVNIAFEVHGTEDMAARQTLTQLRLPAT